MSDMTVARGWTSWSSGRFPRFLVICLLSFITASVAIRFGIKLLNGGDYWTLGDWLINYAGGFTRRGLAGTVTLVLSDWTGISLTWTAGILMLIAYALMAALCIYMFSEVRTSGPVLIMMLSPVLLLMPFYYSKLAMVKETLGFLVLAMCAAAIFSRRREWVWLAFGGYVFACFSHEGMAFYVPFLLVFAWLFAQSGVLSRRGALNFAAAVTVVGAAALLLSAIYPGHGDSAAICASVLERGALPDVCRTHADLEATGPIPWLEASAADGMAFAWAHQIETGVWRQYVLGYGLAILPFFLFRLRDDASQRTQVAVYAAIALSVLAFTPLFVVASDWGRWIAMDVFALTMIALAALRLDLIEPRPVPVGPLFLVYGFGWSLCDYGRGLDPGLFMTMSNVLDRAMSLLQ
ncbi:hypothetical protein HKCCE2091_10140 [Rhodobacterales bacterium HKCCE2091]|nr:hypothetical protein [Rhodobacterales bacterium HKCCE2091]